MMTQENWQKTVIDRLFADAEKVSPADAPAIEVTLVVRGLSHPISGSLSVTTGNVLRMLTPIQLEPPRPRGSLQIGGGRQGAMLEQFFAYEDVVVVGVIRAIQSEQSPLIHAPA